MTRLIQNRRLLHALAALTCLSSARPLLAQDQFNDWPREIETDSLVVTLYQPQVDSLIGDHLYARSAVSVTRKPNGAPVFGAAWSTVRMTTDRDSDIVHLGDVVITRLRFPSVDSTQQAALSELIEKVARQSWTLTTSLASIKTSLAASLQERGGTADGLKFDPPTIVFAKQRTVLVVIDGKPQLRDLPNTSYQRVVNSPYAIVYDPSEKTYYLNGGRFWYTAPAATGPFKHIAEPPAAIANLVPPDSTRAPESDTLPAPAVMVATTPTELISTDGDPVFVPISGTDLLYVSNTDSDVFKDIPTQDYYLLISGRWYASREVTGHWRWIPPDSVPDDFSRIPPDGVKGRVLASVPGTAQADDAVADAAVPQTAAIKRDQATLEVKYDGEPRFEQITGTGILYAVNTPTSVLKINGMYYACSDAVWYVSETATGPWEVSDSVPQSVQQIPPSSPMYNVKYVEVYQSTPDVVYVGYTGGYVGAYPYYGTIVYGTGWYYPPYYGPYYCYPYPYTWGFGAHYSYWGGWGFGYGWSWGFMHAGMVWGGWYRPPGWHGGWYGGGWYGPGGYRPPYYRPPGGYRPGNPGGGYRPRPMPYGGNRNNIYNRPEVRPAVSTRPAIREPGIARDKRNNVFVDRDGNVQRRTNNGWESRDGNRWKSNGRPDNPGLRPTTGGNRPAVNPGSPGNRPPANRPPSSGGNAGSRPQVNPGSPGNRPPGGGQVNPGNTNRPETRPNPADQNRQRLERDYQARQRAQSYSRPPSSPGAGAGGYRPSAPRMGGAGGGGARRR